MCDVALGFFAKHAIGGADKRSEVSALLQAGGKIFFLLFHFILLQHFRWVRPVAGFCVGVAHAGIWDTVCAVAPQILDDQVASEVV